MQARLRAQLGDRSKYSGERRRRSVVVASTVLTITDPLRGSYPLLCNLQAALIRSCGASFACMELTTISRFQRLQASTKPLLLHSLFFIVFQCFRLWHVSNALIHCYLQRNMAKVCPYAVALSFLRDWHSTLSRNHFITRGFFAVKRRAVFILGAKWKALVRGWRRDCVVGGMETRFQ